MSNLKLNFRLFFFILEVMKLLYRILNSTKLCDFCLFIPQNFKRLTHQDSIAFFFPMEFVRFRFNGNLLFTATVIKPDPNCIDGYHLFLSTRGYVAFLEF